ncbi:type 2 isopentenyl-diphosphate Delta-isomerase [Desulfosarcina ovata]|uniref:Isopentenyl-diphosphate delta-isomerase n=2 Tax=Desulfosarcina ovata TaxID=83564 RepID=A0A5K8AE75_9BACT|nr:type 2 isopentenyl-diphosphate Delta-isomerase [Desulfosarcina ovata]BBO84348.1 isopentenyl-diphosphate delta-isomerase [Desulfosarcina ovata subsp. sediminis]BBO90861.1 isopentenyl-diphosphate delta-isomerase [Desulfosarcina ovata subsp. ovata]
MRHDMFAPRADPVATGSTGQRKWEHLRICTQNDVTFEKSSGFECYDLEHQALPERCLEEIDTSTTFLGKKFNLPFFIEAMTGGCPGTETINQNLARAAEEMGIGMGVGSQRAMLDDPSLAYTYQVRSVAPNILLLGNIGAAQLAGRHGKAIAGLIREIDADGIAVHLNAAQELCQPEGDKDWRNMIVHIKEVCTAVNGPIIAKETGCGIAGGIAATLESLGIDALDIAGAGGTSFTRVEHHRGASLAKAFFEWGIPTAASLKQCRCAIQIPIIASGGIRSGVDAAKALAMGASIVGFALPLLIPAMQSYQAVIDKLTQFASELKMAMLLAGAATIQGLSATRVVERACCYGPLMHRPTVS